MNVAGIAFVTSMTLFVAWALVVAHYEDALEAAWIRIVDRVTGMHPTAAEEGDDGYEYY